MKLQSKENELKWKREQRVDNRQEEILGGEISEDRYVYSMYTHN